MGWRFNVAVTTLVDQLSYEVVRPKNIRLGAKFAPVIPIVMKIIIKLHAHS